MSKHREYEICGAALDPGEVCDCKRGNELAFFCTQPPVIFENLDSVRQNLDTMLAEVSALPHDDESLKKVKQIRASLSKDFDALERQRIEVKRQIMEPYSRAEERYKECISEPYHAADLKLKEWVDGYQSGLKSKCEAALRQYFDECCQSLRIDFLKYEDCGVVVDMAMARQKTPSKAIDKIFDFVTAVRTDLDAIATFENCHEILAEYKHSLSLQDAISTVANRNKEKAAAQDYLEARKQHQQELDQHRAELMEAAPEIQPEPEEQYSVCFMATGTLSALKAMKAHAIALGITFADIEQEE